MDKAARILSGNDSLLNLIRECLHNTSQSRPSAGEIVRRITAEGKIVTAMCLALFPGIPWVGRNASHTLFIHACNLKPYARGLGFTCDINVTPMDYKLHWLLGMTELPKQSTEAKSSL